MFSSLQYVPSSDHEYEYASASTVSGPWILLLTLVVQFRLEPATRLPDVSIIYLLIALCVLYWRPCSNFSSSLARIEHIMVTFYILFWHALFSVGPKISRLMDFHLELNYSNVIAISLCHLKLLDLSPLSCIQSGSHLLSNSTLCIVSSSWAPIALPPLCIGVWATQYP